MTAPSIKPLLTALGVLLAPGGTLEAQTPKAPQTSVPVDPYAGAKPRKPAPKKEAPAPQGNYMLGEAPPPGSKVVKAPKPKAGSKARPDRIPYEKRVNLNGASKEELKKLPQMTDEYAARIIAGRPYKSSAALVTDKVVPTTIYYAIKDRVTAGKSPAKK